MGHGPWRRNRIAPQERFGTNHVQALAVPALARVVLAAGAAAALLSLATSAAAASLTAAAAAASPIFRELIGGTDQTELGLDLVLNLLGDGRGCP